MPPTTYLITGTSRGIGLEFVRQLSQRGDQIIAAGDTAEAVDAVLAEIREREPTVPPKESPDEGPL